MQGLELHKKQKALSVTDGYLFKIFYAVDVFSEFE